MKIRDVQANGHKREFIVKTDSGVELCFPYSKAEPPPCRGDRVAQVSVDGELGDEAFTFILESGQEGTVHIDHILEYNEEPGFMADLLLHKLTVKARECISNGSLSHRHIARQLHTSVPQLYRLLDPANYSKSMKQLVALLHVLGCEVEMVVRRKKAA